MNNERGFCLLFVLLFQGCESKVIDLNKFPDDFMFGVATASYQIEGAWNVSDKTESIWDSYTHKHPERVFDHKNGDIAADSYHFFKQDVKLLQRLGVDFYRFSISWPRILPDGFSNKISEDGLRYYNQLIDELLKNNIRPLVTMYHWDLPQSLQDLGGWTNPIVVDYFVDYAEVLLDKFGDRVKAWITFNEPFSFCHDGYGGDDAPGDRSSGFEAYLCGHNVLKAHGRVYRLFEKNYKHSEDSSMGITICMPWMEPASSTAADQRAAERSLQFTFGWFAHPILSTHGDYPPIMRKIIDKNSKLQNYTRSRLPSFTSSEVEMIRGSYDFLGLNHYTTYMIADDHQEVSRFPTFENDVNVAMSQKPEWPKSNSTWLKVVPWGFSKTLLWIRNSYDNPPVLVTENGISSHQGTNDIDRVKYIQSYLKALLLAINVHLCDVVGYTYWSLIDNFEWMRGYSERFGLFEVDYDSPNKTRTPRKSAKFYSRVIKTHYIPSI